MKKLFWCGPVLALLLITACSNVYNTDRGGSIATQSGTTRAVSDSFGNTYLLPWSPLDYEVLFSQFVPADSSGNSTVIGANKRLNDTVWNAVQGSPVKNFKHPTAAQDASGGYSTDGILKSVWDGYTMYIAVEVHDRTPSYLPALQTTNLRMTGPGAAGWNNFDAVEFDIDLFNYKNEGWYLEGLVKVSRNGKLAFHNADSGQPTNATWADPHGDPKAREFTDRLKDWGAYEINNGYVAWLALEVYMGTAPKNGDNFGIEVTIQDSPANNQAKTGRTYWSHKDNSYRFNYQGGLDWGTIVLTGHTAASSSDYAKSDWMLTNPIRWAKGDPWWPGANQYLIHLPDRVADSWTAESWLRLTNAIAAGRQLLTGAADEWGRPHVDWGRFSQQEVIVAAQNVDAAIVSLQWADDVIGSTKFDAPPLNTLPDPLTFKTDGNFGNGAVIPGLTGRKGTLVNSWEDWRLRTREIKAMAAIYEYGPIPDAPSDISVVVQSTPSIPSHWERPGWWILDALPGEVPERPASYSLTASYTYKGTEHATWDGTSDTTITGLTAKPGVQTGAFNISFPSEAQKTANNITGPVPVVLSFSGNTAQYLNRGIAVLNVGTASTTDDRDNSVWYNRTGIMRAFYPYTRGDRYEISNEMGAAWGASRAADVLYKAADMDVYDRNIAITGIASSSDFELGDRITADGVTWWTVGRLNRAANPQDQMGVGGIGMLYLEDGAVPPTASASLSFNQFQRFVQNGVYEPAIRGNASATVTVGNPVPTGKKIRDYVDISKMVTDGFSINGKYAFVAAVFDDRINLTIPGAAGASGPQPWRYISSGNDFSWGVPGGITGNPGGSETINDNVLHNPGRTNEVIRRFLHHFKWYVQSRGIDVNGDFSHGYAERLPFDNHELVASLYPRAIIERNTFNDYNDGSEGDAISLQAALLVYRFLIDKGYGEHKTPAGKNASAEDLIKFNYRATGGHGTDPIQPEREAQYMGWYFYGKDITPAFASHLNTDPFLRDVLVPGGSNSYERHYGGFKVMMPWSWAGPYYPK